jgi:carbon-monoxide dehydrogenase medium subunit
LIDISRIPGLDEIEAQGDALRLGPLVTHNQVVDSTRAVSYAFPLAQACWQVGAPQIRNRGTVAGNLVTASPANDTITPLWAMDATVLLASLARGSRELPFDHFFLGVRRVSMQDDEMVVGINVPTLKPNERGIFLKFGLRESQAVSLVNVAVIVEFATMDGKSDGQPDRHSLVTRARIALGAVAPTIVRASQAEQYLVGQTLTENVIEQTAELAAQAAHPISDVRASAEYRRTLVHLLTEQALCQLCDGTERSDWPDRPVKLWGNGGGRFSVNAHASEFCTESSSPIHFSLNGQPATLLNANGKTLLHALRENAGLIGTKEGCAEGECGACTVWMDGIAVMSCLVPAERADGCQVVTIEGLASENGQLHPIQDAFIREGAVQCGYCTPGFLMSTANLLAEIPHPAQDQITQALSGNLCRCTGYYSIIRAVERAINHNVA